MKQLSYCITDPLGIHARPAGLLVKQAQQFSCELTLFCGEKKADLKRLLAVMGLGVKTGTEITIQATGEDEDNAIKQLEAFLSEYL